jgi:hypothetical protein
MFRSVCKVTHNVLGLCDVGFFLHQSQIELLMLNQNKNGKEAT